MRRLGGPLDDGEELRRLEDKTWVMRMLGTRWWRKRLGYVEVGRLVGKLTRS